MCAMEPGNMSANDTTDGSRYLVVINDEEQYSIWPEGRDIPAGWRAVGKSGPEQDCLDYIETVWTDLRPSSLRKVADCGSG